MRHYLNKNEEAIMNILWKLERGFLKEIVEYFPEPKLPYTTLASTIKKLEKQGLIGFKLFGKTKQYFPILKQDEYNRSNLKNMLQNYFGGSYEQLVSFFMKEKEMDMEELENIYKNLKEKYQDDDNLS